MALTYIKNIQWCQLMLIYLVYAWRSFYFSPSLGRFKSCEKLDLLFMQSSWTHITCNDYLWESTTVYVEASFCFFSDVIYLLTSYLSILESTYFMRLLSPGFLSIYIPIYISLFGDGRIVIFPLSSYFSPSMLRNHPLLNPPNAFLFPLALHCLFTNPLVIFHWESDTKITLIALCKESIQQARIPLVLQKFQSAQSLHIICIPANETGFCWATDW